MDYRNINDNEILYLIKENDELANEILYKKYLPLIKSLAYKYYKYVKTNGADIDDLIQEAYIGVMRAIKSYSSLLNIKFYTFVLICIERQLQMYTKQLLRKKHSVINNAVSLNLFINDTNYTISDVVEDDKTLLPDNYIDEDVFINRITSFKHSLTFVQSQVFELRLNGFNYKEIGILLDLSKKSIDSYLVRARKKLIQEKIVVVT